MVQVVQLLSDLSVRPSINSQYPQREREGKRKSEGEEEVGKREKQRQRERQREYNSTPSLGSTLNLFTHVHI